MNIKSDCSAKFAGCAEEKATCGAGAFLTAALADEAWENSQWLAAVDSIEATPKDEENQRAADGTSWFVGQVINAEEVKQAVWMTTALGVYELYANGQRVGANEALKPGFTNVKVTRRSFTYDITAYFKCGKGESNILAAEVSAGWWRDKIVNYYGKKSGFRAVLEVTYTNGEKKLYGTNTAQWKAGVAGNVTHGGIFDGESYDARQACPALTPEALPPAVLNDEFNGVILPTDGAEVYRRHDLAMVPTSAYCWQGTTGANDLPDKEKIYGVIIKTREFTPGEPMQIAPGETLVVDFAQNCAAVPCFKMKAAAGVTMRCLPAEMLNDTNGARSRGNDGPGGSAYRENLRMPEQGMRIEYTFAGQDEECYMPRFTFFGYRYLSITADGPVEILSLKSIPVSSIHQSAELGQITTGVKDVNKFITNVSWGQLSNYLSVPTDCPQRNERLGWSADTQVFCEAGAFNANTVKFFHKWMRDMRDSRDEDGGFPSVAPYAQYGNETFNLGWADAGVIVPWTIWKQFGDTRIVEDNWDAMVKFLRKVDETKYKYEDKHHIYADWLSYETFESCGNEYGDWEKWKNDPDARNYREFMAACYWLYDARLMVQMANGLGKPAEEFQQCEKRALEYIRSTYLEADGMLLKPMRHLQTACVFALKFGIVEGAAHDATLAILTGSIHDHDDCLQTGFIGTSFLLDVLTAEGRVDVAYTLLLQHKNPSWLYSVDQGATTIWERWNSYTLATGFGNVSMNSFNHYAYGSILAWLYRTAAGIAATTDDPGFATIIMAPKPDRRLGMIKAEYPVKGGVVKSAWHYEGEQWIWEFTVPQGSKALVTLPGEKDAAVYEAGSYTLKQG